MSLAADLAAGLEGLAIFVSSENQRRLLCYVELIEKWNKVHNLTAIREPSQMLAHHILDSLAVLPHLNATRTMLDVGSGAGLPGIPLAIANPELEVTLLDSSHKRHAFQQQCKAELKLTNANPVLSRAQDHRSDAGYEVVISRAFSDLGEFVAASRHLVKQDGRMVAMKGLYPHEEIEKLPEGCSVSGVTELAIPGLQASRHLVELRVN